MCIFIFTKLQPTVGGMASKGLRAMSYQVTRKLKRATNLRIPLKPLLAIPRVELNPPSRIAV